MEQSSIVRFYKKIVSLFIKLGCYIFPVPHCI
jgi:hypothetical protein